MKIFLVIFLFLILGGLYFYQNYYPQITEDPEQNGDSQILRVGDNAIYVPDQRPNSSVKVALVSLAKPGFVVIHENEDGGFGPVLGNSRILPAGESEQITIGLIRSTGNGESLSAVLYEDGGDGAFSPVLDIPVKDLYGDPIFMKFNIDNRASGVENISI